MVSSKKLALFGLFVVYSIHIQAQLSNNLKVSAEGGFPIGKTSDNLGFFIYVEPKLKVHENTFLGIRFGIAINTQTLENENSRQFSFDAASDHGFFSIVPTLDYYWPKERFSPFIGVGVGPYSLANTLDISGFGTGNRDEDNFEVEIGYRLGGLIRGGVEFEKLRIGIEYNFVPETSVTSPFSEKKVGTVNSSYYGFSFGYVLKGKSQ